MTSRGTARLRCSAVLERGHPLLCASPLLVSGEGWSVQRYELHVGGMEPAGVEGREMKALEFAGVERTRICNIVSEYVCVVNFSPVRKQ